MRKVLAFVQARIALIGFVLLVVVAGGVFVWLQNGNGTERLVTVYPETIREHVSISGRVVAVDNVSLGFVQSGRVAGVYARVGDDVTKGSVLAEVENDDIRALILQRRAALLAEEANLESLREGTRPEELALAESDVSSAKVALQQSLLAVIDAMQDAFRASDNAVHVSADQFFSNPRTSPQLSFSTSNTQVENAAESARFNLEPTLTQWETAVASLSISGDIAGALALSKKNLAETAAFLASVATAINQGIETGSVTSATLDSYAADIAAARTSVNAAIATLTSVETAKKTAEAKLESAEKTLVLKQSGATASSLAAQEAKVQGAEAQVLDAEAQLKKTFITAPFSGVVTRVDAEVGESPANGSVISMISSDALEIESFVPEVNVSFLKVNDIAVVTLDAYGEKVPFQARVVSIDPAETVKDGVSTYRTVLVFDEEDPRVKAGMTASITVTTMTKEGVLAVPRGAVFMENGRAIIRVQIGDGVETRTVETGIVGAEGTIEIVSGLNVGDTVIVP